MFVFLTRIFASFAAPAKSGGITFGNTDLLVLISINPKSVGRRRWPPDVRRDVPGKIYFLPKGEIRDVTGRKFQLCCFGSFFSTEFQSAIFAWKCTLNENWRQKSQSVKPIEENRISCRGDRGLVVVVVEKLWNSVWKQGKTRRAAERTQQRGREIWVRVSVFSRFGSFHRKGEEINSHAHNHKPTLTLTDGLWEADGLCLYVFFFFFCGVGCNSQWGKTALTCDAGWVEKRQSPTASNQLFGGLVLESILLSWFFAFSFFFFLEMRWKMSFWHFCNGLVDVGGLWWWFWSWWKYD